MKKLGMAIAGATIVCASFATPQSAFATGPLYARWSSPILYPAGTGGRCQGEVAYATDTQTNVLYARTSSNFACGSDYIEIVYIDNSGVERYTRKTIYPAVSDTASWQYAQVSINRSSYRSIVEIYGTIQYGRYSSDCMAFPGSPSKTYCTR